jgi:hypothetical protein
VIVFLTLLGFLAHPASLTSKVASISIPKSIAEPIHKHLDENAIVVSDGDTELMAFWFRKSIPAKATAEQIKNGLTFREIPETTLIAVVKLSKAFVDYRKQEIPAGVYTLRLVFQPDTGDHSGTAPYTEFLLLCPATRDKSPDETDIKTVVEMSMKATGGDHPGVILVAPDKGEKAEPAITEKDGHATIRCKRTLDINGKEISLGFGMIIKGFSKTR